MYENKDEQLNRQIREKISQARHKAPGDMWGKIEARRKVVSKKPSLWAKSLPFLLVFFIAPFITTDQRWTLNHDEPILTQEGKTTQNLAENSRHKPIETPEKKHSLAAKGGHSLSKNAEEASGIQYLNRYKNINDINHEHRKRPLLELIRPLEVTSHSAHFSLHHETIGHETASRETAETGSAFQSGNKTTGSAAEVQEDAYPNEQSSRITPKPSGSSANASSGSSTANAQLSSNKGNTNSASGNQNALMNTGNNTYDLLNLPLFGTCITQLSPDNLFLSAVDEAEMQLPVRKNGFRVFERKKWFFEFSYLMIQHDMNMSLTSEAGPLMEELMEIKSSGERIFTGEQINFRAGYSFNDHWSIKGGISYSTFRQEINKTVDEIQIDEYEEMEVDSTFLGLVIRDRSDFEPQYDYDTQRYTIPILANDEVRAYTNFAFLNLPLMVDYKFYLSPHFSLFGQAGIVLSQLTTAETTEFRSSVFDFSHFNAETRYKNSFQLGYALGGGLNFHMHHYFNTFIEFNYMAMSNHITYDFEPLRERPSQIGVGIGFRWMLR